MATGQWRLKKVLIQQHQSNWDQGRLRLRAQEEAAKLWAKEGVQSLGIACWHVRVLEQAARRGLHAQVQQEWAHIVGLEGPGRATSQTTGSLFGAERVGREVIQERAMLVLLMEAAAARRRQGQLSEQPGRGEEDHPGQGGWGYADPPGDAVLLTPAPMGPAPPVPGGP